MQDARMLLPGGARGRGFLRAGHQRLERLEERLDAHPRALPGLQERWRQGGRGQRHPGAPPLQSHRPLFKGWPFAREGSGEDQESPRGRDPSQQCLDREHRGRRDSDRRRHRRGDRRSRSRRPSRRQRQRRRSRRRRRRRRNGNPCRMPRRRSTSSTTRRSPIAPGPRSLGSRARSATPSSIASWGFRRRLNADLGGPSLGEHSPVCATTSAAEPCGERYRRLPTVQPDGSSRCGGADASCRIGWDADCVHDRVRTAPSSGDADCCARRRGRATNCRRARAAALPPARLLEDCARICARGGQDRVRTRARARQPEAVQRYVSVRTPARRRAPLSRASPQWLVPSARRARRDTRGRTNVPALLRGRPRGLPSRRDRRSARGAAQQAAARPSSGPERE